VGLTQLIRSLTLILQVRNLGRHTSPFLSQDPGEQRKSRRDFSRAHRQGMYHSTACYVVATLWIACFILCYTLFVRRYWRLEFGIRIRYLRYLLVGCPWYWNWKSHPIPKYHFRRTLPSIRTPCPPYCLAFLCLASHRHAVPPQSRSFSTSQAHRTPSSSVPEHFQPGSAPVRPRTLLDGCEHIFCSSRKFF
jgi:hypothetical protein